MHLVLIPNFVRCKATGSLPYLTRLSLGEGVGSLGQGALPSSRSGQGTPPSSFPPLKWVRVPHPSQVASEYPFPPPPPGGPGQDAMYFHATSHTLC